MDADQAYTAKEIASMMGKSTRAIEIRAKKGSWSYIEAAGKGRGGKTKHYALAALPPDVQEAIYNNKDTEGAATALLPALSPAALCSVADRFIPEMPVMTMTDALVGGNSSAWSTETAISEKDLQDPRIKRILAILRDADEMPRGWTNGKRRWIEAVAAKHDVSFQAIYRWQHKYEKRGIAGIRHEKSSKGKPKVWTPEAIDWWVSLCGKREHRHMHRKDLYDILTIEASRRSWQIGDPASANWWFKKRWSPLMEAMQRGGLRALDNALTPVLRDYSDLPPFEMLVGDQHRFDRWVMDEETGEVYRPEGYLWQDLRTRIIYGAAVDKKYDAWLIGQALRIGIRCYGAFSSIYTDNGKPELSRYLTGILASMRSLGMEWKTTQDIPMDLLDVDGEDIVPHYLEPGTHKKAVVKNAKAKMIEGTFCVLEGIMSSRLRLSGGTKRLGDDIHWQDIDHHEAERLAKDGRLLTDREFVIALYTALDHYNREKAHRGVLREWAWKPKPASATPHDCLRASYNAGWRPRMISAEAADLIFLARAERVVDRGMVNFDNEVYVHDALIELPKVRVGIRYNPMTRDELHVFQSNRYLCTAVPVERSSMLDMDLAARKIQEKRERRKRFADEFRAVTSIAPDFRAYSKVPEAERVAALIGDERRKRAIENKAVYRELSQDELDTEVAKLEQGLPLPAKTEKPVLNRPKYFLDDLARFEWILDMLKAGGELSAEDDAFKTRYLAAQTDDQREYYKFIMEGCR